MSAPEYTTALQRIVPDLATGVTVTGNATAWANSAWYEVVSSLSADMVLVGVYLDCTADAMFKLDIGVGSAGSEVVKATICGKACSDGDDLFFPTVVPIDLFPSGARVAVRLRKDLGGANANKVWLVYYNRAEIAGQLTCATETLTGTPAQQTAVTFGTSWNWGSWVEIDAALSDALILGIAMTCNTGGTYELQLGKGAAGKEEDFATFPIYPQINTSNFIPLGIPVYLSGTNRIAVRGRGTYGALINLQVQYLSSPSLGEPDHWRTSQPMKMVNASGTSVATVSTSATAYTYGSWGQLVASATADLAIVSMPNDTYSTYLQFQLGVGSAGNESPIANLLQLKESGPTMLTEAHLAAARFVPSGSRIAARVARHLAGAVGVGVNIEYYELPL